VVEADDGVAAARIPTARTRPTGVPSDVATSSPRARLLSAGARTTARTSPTTSAGRIARATEVSRPPSDPMTQKRNESNTPGLVRIMAWM
jgi:hypothetical protein